LYVRGAWRYAVAVTTLRSAIRSLVARPQPSLVAIALLAFGIGANVVLFAVADAVMFRPFPFADPDRLVIGGELHAGVRSEVPYPDFIDFRTRTHSFDDIAAMASSGWTGTVRDGEPTAIEYRAVSGNFFDVLGVRAARGRALTSADDTRGAPLAIVLSDAFWRRQFGGDPSVIGRSINLGRKLHTVVGVMPAALTYPERPDAWVAIVPAVAQFPIPGEPDFVENRQVSVLFLVGRLRASVTLNTARSDLDRVTREMAATFGRPPDSATALTLLVDDTIAPARAGLWALLVAVALLLTAAAANVAGLVLLQMSARRREFAIRMALGASMWDIARERLVESSLLTAVASAAAYIAARATLPLLLTLVPQTLPRIEQATVDSRALLYTLVVGALVVGVCGLVPVLGLRSTRLEETLRAGGRSATPGRPQRRSRHVIVVAEIAIAVVLLAGAVLLYRSVAQLSRLDIGFTADRLLAVDVHLPTSIDPGDTLAIHRFYARVIDEVRAIPSVESAAGAAGRPLKGPIGLDSSWQREGQEIDDAKRNPWSNFETVTPTYFQTMGIRVIAGRAFSDDDRATSLPVAIVGETFARRAWPGQSALGKRLRGHDFAKGPAARPWMTVVGVVADVRYRELRSPSLDVYVPYEQAEFSIGDIVVRTRGSADAALSAARARVRTVDPDGLVRFVLMTDEVAREQAPWRTGLQFFAFFALFTTLLAVVGLYALLAAGVAEETHDLGVRMALGASARQIAAGVLKNGGRTAIVGVCAGLAASLGAARVADSVLFGVSASDPASLIAVAAGLLLLAALAGLVPAVRATRVDPIVALRSE
jgi:predicted permease